MYPMIRNVEYKKLILKAKIKNIDESIKNSSKVFNFLTLYILKIIADKINEGKIYIFWENIIGNSIGELTIDKITKLIELFLKLLSIKKHINTKLKKLNSDPKLSHISTNPIKFKISTNPETKKSGCIR